MAGTRLLINVSFLIQLVALLAASVYFGLCQQEDDFICRSFTSQQGRGLFRSGLASTQVETAANRLRKLTQSTPVEFGVEESELIYWQSSLLKTVKQSEDDIIVRPVESDQLLSVCSNPKASEYTHLKDVWICESTSQDGHSDIGTDLAVIHNATLVLYPRTRKNERLENVRQIYPRFSRRRLRHRTGLSIQIITDRADWKEWFHHLNIGIQHAKIDTWPCLNGPPVVEVLFRNLTDKAFISSSDNMDENDFFLIKFKDALSLEHEDKIFLNILLPQSSPMFLIQQEGNTPAASERSRLGQRGDSFAVVVDTSGANPNDRATELALKRTLDRVLQHCMDIPSPLVDSFAVDTDGSLPTLYSKLWYQRTMRGAIESFMTAAQNEQHLFLNLPHTVAVTEEIASLWQNAVDATEAVQSLWLNLRFSEAIQQIHKSLALLQVLQQTPDLLEPMDFPLDQYAAIFAPLLMPLMLPIVVGVVREIKRYKELRKKTKGLAPKH